LSSPPAIVSAVINPTVIATDELLTVFVDWTGDPKVGVTYQWRQSTTRIRGETGPSYMPDGTETSVNCIVTIDNGFGTAIAIALQEARPPVDPEDPEDDITEFSDEFSDEFS
jgi:hypothetical protein